MGSRSVDPSAPADGFAVLLALLGGHPAGLLAQPPGPQPQDSPSIEPAAPAVWPAASTPVLPLPQPGAAVAPWGTAPDGPVAEASAVLPDPASVGGRSANILAAPTTLAATTATLAPRPLLSGAAPDGTDPTTELPVPRPAETATAVAAPRSHGLAEALAQSTPLADATAAPTPSATPNRALTAPLPTESADRIAVPAATAVVEATGADLPPVSGLDLSPRPVRPRMTTPSDPPTGSNAVLGSGADRVAAGAAADRARVEAAVDPSPPQDGVPPPVIASGDAPGAVPAAHASGTRGTDVAQVARGPRISAARETTAPSSEAAIEPLDALTRPAGVVAGEPDGLTQRAAAPEIVAGQRAVPSPVPQPPAIQVAATILQRGSGPVDGLRLQLEPAELGAVEITVSAGERRRARAVVLVERPETLDLLVREQRSIERILVASGLDLPAGGLELGLRQEGGHRRGAFRDPETGASAPNGSPAETRPARRLLSLRLLDLVI